MNNNWAERVSADNAIGNIGKHLARVISRKYANGDLIAKFYESELANELNSTPAIIRVGLYDLWGQKYLVALPPSGGKPRYAMRFPKPVKYDMEQEGIP